MKYVPYFMRDVHEASSRARFTFASGFTGIGGADIGWSLAGGRHAFGVENDAEAVRTFKRNFPHALIEHSDFRHVAASPEIVDRLLRQARLARDGLDVFHCSPPCNEFSKVGPGQQPGGTADMILDVVKMTHLMRPRVLVIENVPELRNRGRAYLDAAFARLHTDDQGRRAYYANTMVLSADDFGVPQRRQRLFVIAVRADVAEAAGVRSDADVLWTFPPPTHQPITLGDALVGLVQSETDLFPFRRAMMTSGSLVALSRKLPHDPERWITARKVGLGTYRFATVRASMNLPSPTLTAMGQQPTGSNGVLHPTEHRKLTLPEIRRFSGFPEDTQFTGTLAQAVTRIGMSVPPLVTKAIGDMLYDRVLRRAIEGAQAAA